MFLRSVAEQPLWISEKSVSWAFMPHGEADVDSALGHFEILLAGDWKLVSAKEQSLLEAGFSAGDEFFEMKSRGTLYRIDVAAMLQINIVTGTSRPIRRAGSEDDWLTKEFFFVAFCKTVGMQEAHVNEIFDHGRIQDFRQISDSGKFMTRGGKPYKIPCGWKRFAVCVLGKYDDNSWLKDEDGGWAVAYHGTDHRHLQSILATGFQVGPRQLFESEVGKGVYCTHAVDVAALYARPRAVAGRSVQLVLQLRVRPEAIKEVTSGNMIENTYWVINDPRDVRAYGVLIRETPSDLQVKKGCCVML